jgi:hypothetical protein
MKKNNRITKAQKMEEFLKSIMKFFNCDCLTIVDSNHWYGEYGRVAYISSSDTIEIHHYENLKRIYKVAHAIWNNTAIEQDNRIAVDNYWHTNTLVLFHNAKCLEGSLYRLSNGQLFDAYGSNWFDVHDSKRLKKMLKRGYQYYSPQEFYSDIYDESEE